MFHLYISKSEFMLKPLAYIQRVEASGQKVVITESGEPTIEIRRYRSGKRPPLEILRGSVVSYINPLEPVSWTE